MFEVKDVFGNVVMIYAVRRCFWVETEFLTWDEDVKRWFWEPSELYDAVVKEGAQP